MSPSIWQILIVVALIMLLFGAGKLPRIMGDMAEGIKSFKRGMRDEEENASPQKADKAPGPKDTLN
ncbi:MAG: twin-arginine translocase TatA/TatE family subunit [Micavibrio sp.]|nr:twin-arginine translocase TatA/TatE family subunit [Micavibrio sp.]|tara:strand:- start:82 stop:279 length:198 start_codon:yes stop_codon:yes gene_type:complete